jgi:hypothetical protein
LGLFWAFDGRFRLFVGFEAFVWRFVAVFQWWSGFFWWLFFVEFALHLCGELRFVCGGVASLYSSSQRLPSGVDSGARVVS